MSRLEAQLRCLRQSGFSMVELMISVTVGLFMVAAVLVAYVSAAENFRLQEAMSEVQEEGRFSTIRMLHDFREAGFDMEEKVAGYPATTASLKALETKAAQEAADGNGDIILSLARIKSGILYLPMKNTAGVAYYVASHSDGSGRQSLYRNKDPIADGVEQFMLELGLDEDNDDVVDLYKQQPGMTAADWANARSIRFTLLISSSLTHVVEAPQQLYWPFGQVDSSDRRLYRTFSGTAVMRNAVL